MCCIVHEFLHLLYTYLALRHAHSFFKSEFSTGCDLELPLKIPVSSLFLKVIQYLLTSSSSFLLPSVLVSMAYFRMQFRTEIMTSPVNLPSFLLFVGYLFPTWLCVTLLHFSHDRSNWYSPSFSSITFQNFRGISHLLSEVSTFRHHTKVWSKCITLLVSYSNLSPVCWWKESACWMPLLPCPSCSYRSLNEVQIPVLRFYSDSKYAIAGRIDSLIRNTQSSLRFSFWLLCIQVSVAWPALVQ
jgi:hypothetical protein